MGYMSVFLVEHCVQHKTGRYTLLQVFTRMQLEVFIRTHNLFSKTCFSTNPAVRLSLMLYLGNAMGITFQTFFQSFHPKEADNATKMQRTTGGERE